MVIVLTDEARCQECDKRVYDLRDRLHLQQREREPDQNRAPSAEYSGGAR